MRRCWILGSCYIYIKPKTVYTFVPWGTERPSSLSKRRYVKIGRPAELFRLRQKLQRALGATWRLQCSSVYDSYYTILYYTFYFQLRLITLLPKKSFLAMIKFLIMGCNMLPTKELHRSLQVAQSTILCFVALCCCSLLKL